MQTVNLHSRKRVDPWTLTPQRMMVAAIILLLGFAGAGSWISSKAGRLNDQNNQLLAERNAAQTRLDTLKSRKPPVADPRLQRQIDELQRFQARLLAVRDTLEVHDAVTTGQLVRALDAIENSDLKAIWLESLEFSANRGTGNRITGRALNSDAVAIYVKRLERNLESLDWAIEKIGVSEQADEPLKFELTLKPRSDEEAG